MNTAPETVAMRCADEPGWPTRDFTVLDGGDHVCTHCGWYQIDHAHGCRELVLSAEWHGGEQLARYIEACGDLPIVGEVRVRIPAEAKDEHDG